MSDFEGLSDKQLIDRTRWITDRVAELSEKLQPYFDELNKLQEEFNIIGNELEQRGFVGVIEDRE